MEYILVGIGGAIGAVARYYLSRILSSTFPLFRVPLGTIVVNTIGSFLLSLLVFSAVERGIPGRNMVLFFGTGFLGAFTTFSTFTYETLSLIESDPMGGFLYVILNLALGFIGAFLGMAIGRGWRF